jgi:hypothetical protein
MNPFIIVLETIKITMKNHIALLSLLKNIVGGKVIFRPPLLHVLASLNVFGILPALSEVAVGEDEDARLIVHLPAAARPCVTDIFVR